MKDWRSYNKIKCYTIKMTDLKFLTENPIAHRGLFNKEQGIPENSIPAFEKAIEKKYTIEMDVHLLKDGKVIIFHDDNLSRMTGINKNIKDCTYDEIKKLKLNNTEYGIPLFTELLELVNGRVPLLIEIKNDRKVGETEKELMKILSSYNGEYAVQSFNPNSLLWFKKNYPNVLRGQLASDFKRDRMFKIKKIFLRNVYFNFITKPNFVSYSINSFPNKRVENYRKNGNLVIGWTVRNDRDLEISKKYCDNIIGENIDKFNI